MISYVNVVITVYFFCLSDQWGTEGTMLKILKLVKTGRQPVNVSSLISKGPVIPGYKRIIAARCFTSILSK